MMNRREFVISTCAGVMGLSAVPSRAGQAKTITPDLAALADGTIGFDVRGQDVPQQSFVGVAFHGANAKAFDAVYFRPFNFKATDPVSRGHAVQYHSLPVYSWDKLRADQPGKYERAVNPVPDPNAWFHARIVIADPKVSVFVGDATDPCLVVNALNGRMTGMVGLWVATTPAETSRTSPSFPPRSPPLRGDRSR
jgi:hypothetical protein